MMKFFRCANGRRRLLLGMVLGVLLSGVPPATAQIWTGACLLELEFEFEHPVESAATLSDPDYTIRVAQAKDLNEDDPETQACVVSLDLFEPYRSTIAAGGGWSVVWTCEATQGSGWWNQGWDPDPPPVFGTHLITGTWGHWTMTLRNPSLNFSGVIDLTVHPDDASKRAECATSGIDSLKMLGVQVFQDPEIPDA